MTSLFCNITDQISNNNCKMTLLSSYSKIAYLMNMNKIYFLTEIIQSTSNKNFWKTIFKIKTQYSVRIPFMKRWYDCMKSWGWKYADENDKYWWECRVDCHDVLNTSELFKAKSSLHIYHFITSFSQHYI